MKKSWIVKVVSSIISSEGTEVVSALTLHCGWLLVETLGRYFRPSAQPHQNSTFYLVMANRGLTWNPPEF